MATTYAEGDRIRIVDREATAEDQKSGLFFNYFRSLTGTIQKVYAAEAAVVIDLEACTEPVAKRHIEIQEAMKAKWLESLSEEGRNRLSPQERDFRLRYTVLVALKDLIEGPPVPEARAIPSNAPAVPAQIEAPKRMSASELAEMEEAELRRRQGHVED